MTSWDRAIKLIGCIVLAAIAALLVPVLVWMLKASILAASQPVSCDDYLSRLVIALGVPCAVLQAYTKAWGWLIVIVIAILLAGIVLLVVRCFLSCFQGDDQDEVPTATINGAGPLLLYGGTETSAPPTLTLECVGRPSGGTFQWAVGGGASKVGIDGGLNESTLMLRALEPSDSPGDVNVQVTYATARGTATAQASLTVHTPRSAAQLSEQVNTFNGPTEYGYDDTVRYRILDQFGNQFPEGDLFLDEDLQVLVNPYNTPFVEKEYQSDANAEYNDHYTLIFRNQPVPSDYLAKVRQVVRAESVQILDHIVVWKSTGVEFQ
jgi:hypothetical protein